MIIGIGVDISKVSRFEKWVKDEKMIPRFFNAAEINNCRSIQSACEHYAARFAAKEAFGKALGVGLAGYDMKDIYIVNDEKGRPELKVENKAKDLLEIIPYSYTLDNLTDINFSVAKDANFNANADVNLKIKNSFNFTRKWIYL